MVTGNRGEWSEIYTLFKLLSDKQLYRGDGDLNRVAGAVFPILKLLRDEADGTYEYTYSPDQQIVFINGAGVQYSFPLADFNAQALSLLQVIKASASPSFEVPAVEAFMSGFNCTSLKAGGSVKSDIRVIIHDALTGTSPELGYSIKSRLGNPSTLLNAGRTTNFAFRIEPVLSEDEIDEINAISTPTKIKDRLARIRQLGKNISFGHLENQVFYNNLTLIDSGLPAIMANIVYLYYTTPSTSLTDLVNDITLANPLHYNLSGGQPFYTYKIKRFLTDIALGMMPGTVWTGQLQATGGYLVVKEDGEVLSYHIYNRNDFEDYLLKHTKLDTASTGRHGFATVYSANGQQFINLNLQIRFIR